MAETITIEQFAKWSYERDVRVIGNGVLGTWNQEKDSYLEEANHYATLPISDWPCGILVQMKRHTEVHPDCTDQSVDQ